VPDASGNFKGISLPAIPWHEPDRARDFEGGALHWAEGEVDWVAVVREDDEPTQE